MKKAPVNKEFFYIKIDDLPITIRTYNCLKKAGIYTLGDIAALNISDLMELKFFGKKSLLDITEILKKYDIDFGSNIQPAPPEVHSTLLFDQAIRLLTLAARKRFEENVEKLMKDSKSA